MRFVYGVVAIFLWMLAISFAASKGMPMPSNDTQFLSVAIIAAGAMAGGDWND